MAKKGGVRFQYLAGICVNICTVSYGAFCGWPSASFLELQADDSPLESGPLSNQDAGWVGSILCMGGILGTMFFSWCADKIGRKRSLLLVALPLLVGWLIIPLSRNVLHLCIARFIGGIAGGGSFAVIPIYIAELAQDSVRGIIGTFLVLSCNIGVLFAFILGYFFSYATVAWISASLIIVFVACFVFLPETPQQLAKQNKITEAENALRYYRNIRSRLSKELSEELQFELKKLRMTETIKENEGEDNEDNEGITWQDFSNRTASKALLIGLVLMALSQFCGCFAMLNYTATIFQQAGSSLAPTVAAIVVGVIQMCGTYMSTMLVERAGRRVLFLISSVGTGLGLACLGIHCYMSSLGYDMSNLAWVPVASFSFTVFIAAWGVLTLPFLVVSEIMPPKILNIANMICMTVLWICSFIVIRFLPLMTEILGMHGTMFFFTTCCFAGAIFIAIFLPETKGKSIEVVLANL